MFFIIIHGLSGSGKTEASKCLSELLGVEEIHPIAPWKRFTEKYYELPEGALDTTEYKEYTPNGMNIAMNQFMVIFIPLGVYSLYSVVSRAPSGNP